VSANQIPPPGLDWIYALLTLDPYLNAFILLIGLVIAGYFVYVLFSVYALPSIERAIRDQHPSDISEQTRQKLQAAIQQDTDRILAEAGHPSHPVVHRTIHLPFGTIILATGLWFLAKRETPSLNAAPASSKREPLA
jgi:hypothetical protein